MGTQGVQKKGVLDWLVRWARCAGTRYFFPALAAQVQNMFFLTVHYTISFVPIAQQAVQCTGSRAGSPFLSVYLCFQVLRNVYKTIQTNGTLYSVHATV